jgi:hypothetical protein
MNDKHTESQITVELEQQIQSYIELYPSEVNEYSVGAFVKHLAESYE